MTTPTKDTSIEGLIERLRNATGPDRELDEAIALALCDDHFFAQLADAPEGVGCEMYSFGRHAPHSALRVTVSIDAALALVERVLPGRHVAMGTVGENDTPWACLTEPIEPCRDFAADGVDIPNAILMALFTALKEADK